MDKGKEGTKVDADAVADALVKRLSDPKTVEQIMDVWSITINKATGRAFWTLFRNAVIGLTILVGLKLAILDKAIASFFGVSK